MSKVWQIFIHKLQSRETPTRAHEEREICMLWNKGTYHSSADLSCGLSASDHPHKTHDFTIQRQFPVTTISQVDHQEFPTTMAAICIRPRILRKYTTRVTTIVLLVATVVVYILLHHHKPFDRLNDMTSINVYQWSDNPTKACNGHLTGYANEFVHLTYARFNKMRKSFALPCEERLPAYRFLHGSEGTPLIGWYRNLSMFPYSKVANVKLHDVPTFVVMRIEAHNLYHTLCEWYNVFLVSQLIGFKPKEVDILFLDDRPRGLMDDTWDTLFGTVHRYTDVPANVVYKDLVWNMIGYESPVNFHGLHRLPFMDDFYMFFLRSFGVERPKSLDCSQLSVTVIWRRDYMTHPERQNMTGGLVHRKFYNEKEIEQEINFIFRGGHRVRYVVLENMSMKEQIAVFTATDILVGMHGAGMSHVLFLPPHAGVFELFPNYWGFLKHFKAFARWRNIHYIGWENKDPKNEYPAFYTRIPDYVIQSNVEYLKRRLCPP